MSTPRKKTFEVLLPPAVGYSFSILINFFLQNKITFRYYPRMMALGLINIINMPFRAYERLMINPRFKKIRISEDPVFIIGHWRSGTTHLHNILSKDEQMGYLTTFQGVFPDTLFNKAGSFIFRNFTKLLIPATRQGDNVTLDSDNPQEEEFALGDKTPLCYYYFWMFPRNTLKYYDRALRQKGISPGMMNKWKMDYELLIKKSLKNTNRTRFLSKNPPNTARIKVLLDMFPNARFIYIHRNPVEVFLSTSHFFNVMMPHLQLQHITDNEREDLSLKVYKRMMHDYLTDKYLIPSQNLIEISFDGLEQKPMDILKEVYNHLHIPGFKKASPSFSEYIQSMKSYKKNRHTISRNKLDKVLSEWQFAMDQWGYDIPENIDITIR